MPENNRDLILLRIEKERLHQGEICTGNLEDEEDFFRKTRELKKKKIQGRERTCRMNLEAIFLG